MKRVSTTLAVGALTIIAAAAIAGHRDSATVLDSGEILVRPAVRMPAAVVLATPPSISELLDIVLGDRGDAGNEAIGSGVNRAGAGTVTAGSEEARIATVLQRYTSDRRRADRIATALVREGRRRNIGSQLLVGVLLVENPWLNPRATSFVGARGLMQVMPFHAGNWGCPSPDLFDIESNVCHGVAILADNIRHAKTLPEALLGYNGCVRGTNTPDCWRYPSQVFRLARMNTAAAGTPARLMPFSFGYSALPRSARRAPAVRQREILLPRELLVE